jgi:hypothetical protein
MTAGYNTAGVEEHEFSVFPQIFAIYVICTIVDAFKIPLKHSRSLQGAAIQNCYLFNQFIY